MTEFLVKEEYRGKGLGRRLLGTRPEWTDDGMNIWLNSVEAAINLYPKFGFTVMADEGLFFVRGQPHVKASILESATSDISIVDGGQTGFLEFLEYESSVLNISAELEALMRRMAESGTVIVAKRADKTVGVVLCRYTNELPDAKLCRLVLFADSSEIAIKLITFVNLNRQQDFELLMTSPQLHGNIRAVADHFDLRIIPVGRAMFTLRDVCKRDMKMDKIYSFIPI
jgi:hypothetical protein